jgi:hypothetical protein
LTCLYVTSTRLPLPSELREVNDRSLEVVVTLLNTSAIKSLIACPYLDNLRTLDVVAGEDVSEEMAKEYYRRFRRHLVRSPHA